MSWWPFLLNPDLPPEGIDRTTYLIRKFGSEARVGRIHMAIADVGQSVEIDFAFDRIRRTPNTVSAHRLVRFGALYGCADRLVESLFYNHFVRGRDIGDTRVLLQIGSDADLDVRLLRTFLRSDADLAVVYGENARAHRLGINGVPAFVFNGSFVTCGAQEPAVLARMIDVAREAERYVRCRDRRRVGRDALAKRRPGRRRSARRSQHLPVAHPEPPGQKRASPEPVSPFALRVYILLRG